MTGYRGCLSELYSLEGKLRSRQYLVGMRKLLSKLGNPQDDFESIIVAGTNGKGSVAAMTASALSESGLSVGMYLSPHIDSFRERITVGGKWIPGRRFCEVYETVKRASKGTEQVTVFEFATSMMFQYFSEEGVDCAVLEVGLGGRLDATNVARSRLGAVTSIGLEHTEVLGKSLGKIAYEKAGIARRGGIVVTAETKPEAFGAIKRECKAREARVIGVRAGNAGRGNAIGFEEVECTSESNEYLVFGTKNDYSVSLSMLGRHQGANAAVSCGLSELMGLEAEDIEKGIGKAKLPCRLEVVSRNPAVVMDCAHNPHAAKELAKALMLFDYHRLILVSGMMGDKDCEGFFRELGKVSDVMIVNEPDYSRAAKLPVIFEAAKKSCQKVVGVKDVRLSVSVAKEIARARDLICVAGSIYMLSEARGHLPGLAQ